MLFIGIASAFAVVFLNSLVYGLSAESVLESLVHTFFIASSVSIGILFIAPKVDGLSTLKRVQILICVIFAATIIGIFLTKLFGSMFNPRGFEMSFLIPGQRTAVFSLLISYIFGFGGYFYLYSQNKLGRARKLLRQKELDEARAKSLAISSQLASLESRIHPHFLFNTLNSIAALIRENPSRAEKMVEKLSALLRYSLDFEPNKLVTLAEELKITRDYLEIESTRFAEKLQYNFDIQKSVLNEKIPAFSLQTLVENSIKHVASKRSTKTKIYISATKLDENVMIEVSDNGGGFSIKDIKTGHGLDTLKKRLQNIFDDKAGLEIIDGKKVRLEIRV